MIVTTTTTLTIGLALHKVTDSPFARTRAATRGPDIVAEINPPSATRSAVTRGFAPLVQARRRRRHVRSVSDRVHRAELTRGRRAGRGRGPRRRPGGDRPAGAHRRAVGRARPGRDRAGVRRCARPRRRRHDPPRRAAVPRRRDRGQHRSVLLPDHRPRADLAHTVRRGLACPPAAACRVHPQPEADRSVVRPGVRERQRRQRVLQRHQQPGQVVPVVLAGHRAAGLQGRLGRSEGPR